MSHSPYSLQAQDQGCPAFQPGSYVGWEGTIGNMLRRLDRGHSLSNVGSPKLGKTSLLLHLSWHLNRPSSSRSSNGPVAKYFDVGVEADGERLQDRSPKTGAIVMLDNCDRVVDVNPHLLSFLKLNCLKIKRSCLPVH